MPRGNRARLGGEGERRAARYLRKRGYRILRRNCRTRLGEIDLICRDGDTVVFVEVKTRTSSARGDPADALHPAQRRRIRNAARLFAGRHNLHDRPLRFDVVAVLLAPGREPEVAHFEDAFPLA